MVGRIEEIEGEVADAVEESNFPRSYCMSRLGQCVKAVVPRILGQRGRLEAGQYWE